MHYTNGISQTILSRDWRFSLEIWAFEAQRPCSRARSAKHNWVTTALMKVIFPWVYDSLLFPNANHWRCGDDQDDHEPCHESHHDEQHCVVFFCRLYGCPLQKSLTRVNKLQSSSWISKVQDTIVIYNPHVRKMEKKPCSCFLQCRWDQAAARWRRTLHTRPASSGSSPRLQSWGLSHSGTRSTPLEWSSLSWGKKR